MIGVGDSVQAIFARGGPIEIDRARGWIRASEVGDLRRWNDGGRLVRGDRRAGVAILVEGPDREVIGRFSFEVCFRVGFRGAEGAGDGKRNERPFAGSRTEGGDVGLGVRGAELVLTCRAEVAIVAGGVPGQCDTTDSSEEASSTASSASCT